ncbi:MAG TPA: hypothetical protein GX722_06745 [Clostridiales bacterium]|nr:hypothetical protein [Clostridiales bacterium]
MRRILSLLISLILMVAFYLYAVMREDEETKRTEQWVVAAEQAELQPNGGAMSIEGRVLARAMGVSLPLPQALVSGRVEDTTWHGYYARRLHATDGATVVHAVRPVSAAPMIRQDAGTYAPSGRSLFGHPMLETQDDTTHYAFFTTQDMAVLIETPLESFEQSLQALQLVTD